MSFLSHIRVGGEIARGGMGSVHLAFREVGPFRRTLALKRPLGGKTGTDAEQELLEEARLAAQVRHPNVIEVLDVGVDADGLFLVMDYVEGRSLRDIKELPLQLALWVVRCVASALEAAHAGEQAIVHRDVSPANVMVGYDGSVRLMDFGLARPVQDPRTSRYLRGSPGYVAPEALRFDPISTSADVFALGVILHELVTKTRLYGDSDIRVVAKRILDEEPPALSASPALSVLTARMLAKDAADRPSAAEVVRTIEAERRALVRDEGALMLDAHMAENFGDELFEKRRWLREQWAALEARPVTEEAPAEPQPTRPPRRGHARLIIALSLVMALTLIATSVLNMTPAVVVTKARPAPSEPDEHPAPAPVMLEAEVLEAEVLEADEAQEPQEVDAAATETQAAPSRVRPSRMRVRMRNDSPTKMGRDLWGW